MKPYLALVCGNLGMSKGELRRRPDFNFDSGNAANLEAAIAILRVTEALRLRSFTDLSLVRPPKGLPSADLTCRKNGQLVCCEVKTITKQSDGRKGLFFADQLYEKILENIGRARTQLEETANSLGCAVKIFVSVVNWFSQSVHLNEGDYQTVVDRLEKDQDQESLKGIDGVFFVTKMGQHFLFTNERARSVA